MDALVLLVGALLSRLHELLGVDVCPGGWAWSVTALGALVGLLPTVGAIVVGRVRRTGAAGYRSHPGPVLAGTAVLSCGVLPWTVFAATGELFGRPAAASGLDRADRLSLASESCLGITERAYLGSDPVSEALGDGLMRTALFAGPLVVFPLVVTGLVWAQGRLALRRGPSGYARFFGLSILAVALLTGPMPAGAVAQLWTGVLAGTGAGLFVAMLVPPPRTRTAQAPLPGSGAPAPGARPVPSAEARPMPGARPMAARRARSRSWLDGAPRRLRARLSGGWPVVAVNGRPRGSAGWASAVERAVPVDVAAVGGMAKAGMVATAVGLARAVQRLWRATGVPGDPRTATGGVPAVPPSVPVPAPRPPATLVGPPDGVENRFELVRGLGAGGFGGVWLAHDHVRGHRVAVKAAHAPDAMAEARIRREARALSAVRHPNCVRIFDLVDSRSDRGLVGLHGLVIVMEHLDGGSLGELVQLRGPLDDRAAGRIWLLLAGALAAAHDQGVLHRDVKPANVLVDPAGEPHLIDFGIARARGDATLTQHGFVLGTPDYLAPEVARGGPASTASDSWQLAATMSFALTGWPPRGGGREDPMSGLRAAASSAPPTHLPVRSAHRDLLRACLAGDPGARPTLAVVRESLDTWLVRSGADPRRAVTSPRPY